MTRFFVLIFLTIFSLYADVEWSKAYSIPDSTYNAAIKVYVDSRYADQLIAIRTKKDFDNKRNKIEIIIRKVTQLYNKKKYFDAINELNKLNNNSIVNPNYLSDVRETIIQALKDQTHSDMQIDIKKLVQRNP